MTTEGFKRKLTAILHADVKGYSRLMGEDEIATLQTLTAYLEVFKTLIQQYRGRVVGTEGDAILAEFASVVDSVQCAVEIQQVLKAKNADVPEDRKMEFRIGVNLGDVIEEGEQIYGDGVNIAARIEALAEGGGISISGSAYEQIKNKLALGYEYLGEHAVKNITEPVRVYRVPMEPRVSREKKAGLKKWKVAALAAVVVLVVAAGAWAMWNFYFRPPPIEPASADRMAFPLPEKPSIAVLPFVNMSGDPEQEYFSDGITEQIITSISKIPRLFVIARTSSFKYKGKAVDVQQVSRELGVKYVLEGSVQRSGDRLRITAQLIDAITGKHLWAERYDRDIKDIFALQDEITMKILTALRLKLTDGERVRLCSGRTDNLKAFEKVLEGVPYLRAFNIESNATARQLAEEAIALDPKYAHAYSLLAVTHFMDVHLGSSKSPRKSFGQATKLLQKAIALDENYASAHSYLCHIYGMQRQYEKAIAEGEKAVALNPNSDEALVWLAMTMDWVGRPEEAIALHKKALRLCPFPPSYYYLNLGHAYRSTDRCKEAITEYKKALHLTPNNVFAFGGLAISYSLLGREEEARAAAAELRSINPKFSLKGYVKRLPHKDQALKERWRDALRKAGLK